MISARDAMTARLGFTWLTPISLDEIVSEAALLQRVDRKYLLPADAATQVLGSLDPHTRVLEIDGQRTFAYDSVYFDTDDFAVYRLTAQRRRHRFKLRTRTYVDTGGCFLEVKTKDGRGMTIKTRIPWDTADRSKLTTPGRNFAASVLEPHGVDASLVAQLTPSMTSRYQRTTLLLPGGSRATIDTDLHWLDADGREIRADGNVIIETKSAQRVSDLDRALWRAGHRPSGISKFGVGTAALYPSLPHNKWARVLGHSFSRSPKSAIPTTLESL
ncbi:MULTISPECIES: polyphosphate polymerase domain-containing protein [unclassified Leucobacter]|uniref:polyphosphate polymerase domain-containing protein n=1 Tax=unclassified Leucobacter TaxID=2621730 RepID=UPI00203DF64F|nr:MULTISPECIES: polyphosphate polymerase domain-containing protein [unclassified Leucobacter]